MSTTDKRWKLLKDLKDCATERNCIIKLNQNELLVIPQCYEDEWGEIIGSSILKYHINKNKYDKFAEYPEGETICDSMVQVLI